MGFPADLTQARDRGSGVEPRPALFTQLWGSPGPGEREDVFRVSLIMAASEEINRQGPAGDAAAPATGRGSGVAAQHVGKYGGVGETRMGGDRQGRRWTRTPGDTP